MPKYWAMSPAEYAPKGNDGIRFQECWKYDLEHGVISIGWNLGEKPESQRDLYSLWEHFACPEWNKTREGQPYRSWPPHGLRMLERFWFEIEPGDMVVAKAGLNHYVGVGEFQEESFYDGSAMDRTWGCSFRRVRWEPSLGIRPSPVNFTQATLHSLEPGKFRQFRLK